MKAAGILTVNATVCDSLCIVTTQMPYKDREPNGEQSAQERSCFSTQGARPGWQNCTLLYLLVFPKHHVTQTRKQDHYISFSHFPQPSGIAGFWQSWGSGVSSGITPPPPQDFPRVYKGGHFKVSKTRGLIFLLSSSH